jgi:hypothetical protein
MRRYEFETHRWSRMRNDERVLECVIAAVRDGWTVLGYEVRVYSQRQLLYRSRQFLERRFALQEADALLRETIGSIKGHNAGRGPIDAHSAV